MYIKLVGIGFPVLLENISFSYTARCGTPSNNRKAYIVNLGTKKHNLYQTANFKLIDSHLSIDKIYNNQNDCKH